MCIFLYPVTEQIVIFAFLMLMGALAAVGIVMMPVMPIFLLIVVVSFAVAVIFSNFLQRINGQNDPHEWPVIQVQNQADLSVGYLDIIWGILVFIWGTFTLILAWARPEEPDNQQPNEDDPPNRPIPNGRILRRRRR